MTYPDNCVLVVCELAADGGLPETISELCGAASAIGTPVVLLIAPGEVAETTTNTIAQAGAEHIAIVVQDYSQLGSAVAAVEEAISEFSPVATLFIADADGTDLAGRAAVHVQRALLSNVTGIDRDDEGIIAYHSVLGDTYDVTSAATFNSPIITLRRNAVEQRAKPGAGHKTELQAAALSPAAIITESTALPQTSGRPALPNAKVVVTGGRGFSSTEEFQAVEDLADALGGAVGATRAAVDAGYVDPAAQIGHSGVSVQPDVYFALALSGAIQHVSGMKSSKHIIAINKDEDAPIFDIADFGVVGDVVEILPKLTSLLAQRKG